MHTSCTCQGLTTNHPAAVARTPTHARTQTRRAKATHVDAHVVTQAHTDKARAQRDRFVLFVELFEVRTPQHQHTGDQTHDEKRTHIPGETDT